MRFSTAEMHLAFQFLQLGGLKIFLGKTSVRVKVGSSRGCLRLIRVRDEIGLTFPSDVPAEEINWKKQNAVMVEI